MKRLLTSLLCLLTIVSIRADYTDVPYSIDSNGQFTVSGYTFSTKTGYYQEWDHYVIFWSTAYGQQSGTPTTLGSGNYLLDLESMKVYAELCHANYTKLGFLDPTSADGGGHKIIILAYYSTDWFATGSGEISGNQIYGVLNIAHSSANSVKSNANPTPMYTYCHEIAHAYQFLGYAKNKGNAGFNYSSGMYGWVSYYECCANWQASQEYLESYFPQCNVIYNKTNNLAFTHAWHSYQCYPLNDYLVEKCNEQVIGDIWTTNTNVAYAEPLEKYMTIYNKSAEEVYRDVFLAAMRMTTWDLDRWQDYLSAEGKAQDYYMNHVPGTKACASSNTYQTQSTYQYVTTDATNAIHQVAYSSAPQSSGYNCIKLNVPSSSNRTVTTTFTALPTGSSLASGDNKEYWCGDKWLTASSVSSYNTGATAQSNSNYNTYKNWRGFRLGYVAYQKSTGKRYYNYTDEVYCTGTDESSVSVSFTVPDDVDSLYLVVSPALSNYLRNESSGQYDVNYDSESDILNFQKTFDQWPYRVQFYNTNIYGLSTPSTSFSGTASSGTTYTTEQLPDLGTGVGEEEESTTSDVSVTLEKNVTIDNSDETTTSATVTLGNSDLNTIASAFNLNTLTLAMAAMNMTDYSETQAANTIMFLPATTDEKLSSGSSNCTDDTYSYGHWFDTKGNYTEADSDAAQLYAQFAPMKYTFNIGMKDAKNGTYTISQALRYYDGTSYYIAYVKFNVTITGTIHHTATSVSLEKKIQYDPTTSDSDDYSGGTLTLSDEDLTTIAGCFGISASEITDETNWETWTSNGPSEGKITFYGVNADGTTLKDTCSTANGYGHWFNMDDEVAAYGDNSSVYSEYDVASATFSLGQMPGALSDGDTHNITQAIVFTESGNQYIAYIHFAIQIGEEKTEGTDITDIRNSEEITNIYTPMGIRLNHLQKGINLIRTKNGSVQKILIK